VTAAAPGTEIAEILEEVRRIDVLSRRLVAGIVAGEFHSVFRGTGIEFEEVREYVPGDDPRSIDWNVTARTGRPFVKKFTDEREQTVLFVLDLSPSMDAGWGSVTPRRAAARVAACLALSAVRNDDKVGLLAAGRGPVARVAPRKGTAQAMRVLRDCLALEAAEGAGDLGAALAAAARTVRRRAVLFVLSDFLGRGWREPLARCARRHDVVAVHLLSPELLEPPAGGLLRLRDPAGGREVLLDFDHPPVRAAAAERLAAWRESTRRDLLQAGADLMDVPIPAARERDLVAAPLLRFFRMRELRRSR